MLKKAFTFILALVFISSVCISSPEFAYADEPSSDISFGESITYTLSEEGVLTLSGEGAISRITGSSNINLNILKSKTVSIVVENGITEIGMNAFIGFEHIADATVAGSVKNIAPFAFKSCKELKNVTIADGLESIEHEAFLYCSGLESISLPETLTTIGYNAFSECEALKSLNLPTGLKTIEDSAFYPCTGLEGIEVKSGNAEFSSSDGVLFNKDRTALICYPSAKVGDSYTIPDGVESIENRAFMNCKYLKDIIIPENINIAHENFDACEDLVKITLGDSIEGIHKDLFGTTAYYQDEQNWETDGLYIGKYLIAVKDSCTSYEVKDGTLAIAGRAFSGCHSLEKVTIPRSVTSIGESVFSIYPELTIYGYTNSYAQEYANINNIRFVALDESDTNTEKPTDSDKPANSGKCGDNLTWSFNESTGTLTISGTGEMDNWLEHVDTPWYSHADDIKSIVIEDGVTSIGSYAFCALTKAKSVTIPNSVTDMKDHCFWGCESLESVTIPKDVESIAFCAFADCKSLKNVTLPDGLKNIESNSFTNCASLEGIVIPDGVTSIGSNAFSGCSGLKDITIPNGVKSIEAALFVGCTSLSKVMLWGDIASINDKAFAGCTSLKSITLPVCLENIGNGAFSGCTSLKTIVIPVEVTTIGDYAFSGCTGLESIVIGSVTSIGDNAFDKCDPTVYGRTGTYAEEYAKKHNLKFALVSEYSSPDSDMSNILGDANGDGNVTMEDVVLVQKQIAKLAEFTPEQTKSADVNTDGEVTMLDVTTIQKYIARLIEEF